MKSVRGLRGIVTGYNSLVGKTERWLKKLLTPLLEKCDLLIDSNKTFKKRFLEERKKFEEKNHEIVSYDAKQLFHSVNVDRVISYILSEIYKSPRKFFRERNENGKLLPIPQRENFREVLHSILVERSFFNTQIGLFRQKKGLSMGSALSPLLANLFLGILERSIVRELQKAGHVVSWLRYADDIITITKKGSRDLILQKLNQWDHHLSFTSETMSENKLKFLDCLIFIKEGKIEFEKVWRNGLDTVLSNYRKSVISPRYTENNILTQLHRTRDSCSSEELFNHKIKDLKTIFKRNSYPSNLFDKKFAIFQKNDQKPPRPDFHCTITLDYTSQKIEKHIRELVKLMKKYVHEFQVNICYRTFKVQNLYSGSAKAPLPTFDCTNLVYKFQCPCSSTYVGETERELKVRAREHQQESRGKTIYDHIHSCDLFVKNRAKFVVQKRRERDKRPVVKIRFDFFINHFSIIQKNFVSKYQRTKTEAFLIKVLKPELNEQVDNLSFKLF